MVGGHCQSVSQCPADLSICQQQALHRSLMPSVPLYAAMQAVQRLGELKGAAAALAHNDMPAQKGTQGAVRPLILS